MELNKKNIKIIIGIIIFTITLISILGHVNSVLSFIQGILALFTPFILGASIAFIVNVPMTFLENAIFRKIKIKQGIKRVLSLVLTLVLVIAMIFVVLFLVIPEIGKTLGIIAVEVPTAATNLVAWIDDLSKKNPQVISWVTQLNINWQSYLEKIANTLKSTMEDAITSTFGILSGTLSAVFNFLIGFVFSIYILLQKEKLGRQGKQIMFAFLTTEKADKFLYIFKFTNTTFQKFLTGQCTEAIILGVLFFICMSIIGIPYALLISVLIAVTALIPVFGAAIGCVIGTFLILFVNPMHALWFLILFFVLQQIEGNLIYPHVVGNSVGLPSIWVLVAVIIGGNLLGVMGMLIFIPLSSVLYTLFREEVKKRIIAKKIPSSKLES